MPADHDHDHEGEDLGLLEHPAPNLEPGDVVVLERAADLQTLDAIIAAPKSLASDRIRAVEAKQRILAKQQEAQQKERYGPLVAPKEALEALSPEERVEALTRLLVVKQPREGHSQSPPTRGATQGGDKQARAR